MNSVVIMAGGQGRRFWPRSRLDFPKQFLSIIGNESLLQSTVRRFASFIPIDNIYVVTHKRYLELTKKQLPFLPETNLILEPESRDTAACIGLAAIHLQQAGKDPVMITAPADSYIQDLAEFQKCITNSVELVNSKNTVVTIGIPPTKPETGYGYIKVVPNDKGDCYEVARFVEKPSAQLARKYVASGGYFWNSGIFVWKASTALQLIRSHMPQLNSGLEKIRQIMKTKKHDGEELARIYSNLPKISIDYGVIEKTDSIQMIPGRFAWNDMGNWTALESVPIAKDLNNNVIVGTGIGFDTCNSILDGAEIPVIAVGMENVIIVATKDAILVCHKEREQEIKAIHNLLTQHRLDHLL